ncbi:HNH/ENDO VII family nuclease [Fusobacterium pseudoperiodonticum]|jgi:hypothetical protein|uniref:HNH/ENDO VII family nuclease n=1 Tax=Fusobacterium pseudoperiodonticum TaxID=2663009 RepID=UPI0028E67FA2|nr:HNH/ENDO VII family nuclease [Fusobacterium pseudoperiodonticum]
MKNPEIKNNPIVMRDGVDILGKKNEIKIEDVLGKINPNKNLNPNSEILSQVKENYSKEANESPETRKELSDEEKQRIKEETGWSDEIIDAISSMEEYEIYKKADLEEKEINGKKCLVRKDIDLEQKDSMGRTNSERMEKGLPPLDKNGRPIELHHIGQKSDSPLAELTTSEHRGKGNDTVLHDKKKESEIDRDKFAEERSEHWKNRSEL